MTPGGSWCPVQKMEPRQAKANSRSPQEARWTSRVLKAKTIRSSPVAKPSLEDPKLRGGVLVWVSPRESLKEYVRGRIRFCLQPAEYLALHGLEGMGLGSSALAVVFDSSRPSDSTDDSRCRCLTSYWRAGREHQQRQEGATTIGSSHQSLPVIGQSVGASI